MKENTPIRRKRFFTLAGLIAIAVILFFWWDYVLAFFWMNGALILEGGPTQKDEEDAREVCNQVIARHSFDRTLKLIPGKPPVLCSPGSKSLVTMPLEVTIYYLTKVEEQDKIVDELRELRRTRNTKPIKVKFLAEENWIVTSFGGERGPERLLREATIR